MQALSSKIRRYKLAGIREGERGTETEGERVSFLH